jgi:hypothetical protein
MENFPGMKNEKVSQNGELWRKTEETNNNNKVSIVQQKWKLKTLPSPNETDRKTCFHSTRS